MKRQLLPLLLALLVGIGVVKADNVMINVDNAANVTVTVKNGTVTVPLFDGMNRITEYSAADSPLMISAAGGASIVSVTKNQETVLNPNYVGDYTMAIENMMLDIVTEGGDDTDRPVQVWLQLSGANGSATITDEAGSLVFFSSTNFLYADIIPDAVYTVTPNDGYIIKSVVADKGTVTDLGDGRFTFSTSYDKDNVTVTTEEAPVEGTEFFVNTPYQPNLVVRAGKSTNTGEEWLPLEIRANGAANLPEGWEYIDFTGADDSKVLSVTRNGEAIRFSQYVGWRSAVEEGDIFVVATEGPAQEVKFSSNDFANGVGLEAFSITAAGELLDLRGENQTVSLHRGDQITVSGKGKNSIKWVICGNGIYETDPCEFNLEANTLVTISGSVTAGVFINVTGAEYVKAVQLNGYGDALPLSEGDNTFTAEEIKNNLNFVAAEGCQILSVKVNGSPLQAANDGAYSVTTANGMEIEVVARQIPTSLPVTVMVLDSEANDAPSADFAKLLTLSVAGEVKELEDATTTLTVPYQGRVDLSCTAFGYVIDEISSGNNYISENNGVYTFYAEEACTLMVRMHQIVAPEGSALVEVSANSPKVSFLIYDKDGERVGSITSAAPGIVEIGGSVGIKKFSYDLLFKSILVNGSPIEIDDEQEAFQEYQVKIEKETVIEATLYDPNSGLVNVICWKTDDTVFGLNQALLYVKADDGSLVDNYWAAPGETIQFVVPYVAPGYELTCVEGKNTGNTALIDPKVMTYTVPSDIFETQTEDPLLIFSPAIVTDALNPPYVVEFYNTYKDSEEEDGAKEVIGYPVGIEDYFNGTEMARRETQLMYATAGMSIDVNCYARDDYESVRIYNYDNQTLSIPYVVSEDDSFEVAGMRKINVGLELKLKDDSVNDIEAGSTLRYDALEGAIYGEGNVEVYDLAGVKVAEGEKISVASLTSGTYVARDVRSTIKFIKK